MCCSRSVRASRENVEKVVKPPHTPVFKNKVHFWGKEGFAEASPVTKPITSAPRKLVHKVRIGKADLMGSRLMPYQDPFLEVSEDNSCQTGKRMVNF